MDEITKCIKAYMRLKLYAISEAGASVGFSQLQLTSASASVQAKPFANPVAATLNGAILDFEICGFQTDVCRTQISTDGYICR